MPHPLQHKVELKIQTNSASTPSKALAQAIKALQSQFVQLEMEFASEVNAKKQHVDLGWH